MSERLQDFAKRAAAIQVRCACRCWHPRECYLNRHNLVDHGLGDGFWHAEADGSDFDECECVCHDELLVLEEEFWPDNEGAADSEGRRE